MLRLSNATLNLAKPQTRKPAYDRAALMPGILHFGPGAFHRAHQAAYVDTVLEQDPRWSISAVALHSTRIARALGPQDGLYTLNLLGTTVSARIIGALTEILTGLTLHASPPGSAHPGHGW